jgi:hypothetical protein
MAKGPMAVRVALGDGTRFAAPVTLGEDETELGRIDAAAWRDGWLVTRVRTPERTPTLFVTTLAADGSALVEQSIAGPVGGYPRIAVDRDVVLLVFTEPVAAGDSRVGIVRAH